LLTIIPSVQARLLESMHLMLQGVKVDDHAPHPRRRCHVEMVAVPAEARMAVTMNVGPARIGLQELT
jgi:hypothetical protein